MKLSYFLSAFVVSAIIYLVSLGFAEYPYQYVVKVVPMLLLLGLCICHLHGAKRLLFSCAIVASATGDIYLALPIPNSFIFGLGAFLIAQIIYTYSFVHFRKPEKLTGMAKIMSFVIVCYSLCMGFYILPNTHDLFLPVTAYLTVITLMTVSAWLSNLSIALKVGALSFLLSDSLIAINMFKVPIVYSGFFIMLTYYAAQGLIIAGITRRQ